MSLVRAACTSGSAGYIAATSTSSQSPAPAPQQVGYLPPAVTRPLLLASCAAVLDALLSAHLYLRPAPVGGPFALNAAPYLLRAIYYGAWAHGLVALPFLAFGWLRARRAQGPSWAAELLQIGLTMALLLAGGFDREFQRYLGMHVSVAWFSTYASVNRTPEVIWSALREDRGGAWSSMWGLAATIVYAPLALWLARVRIPRQLARRRNSGALAVLVVVWPTLLWNVIPGGIQRQNKVRPALLTLLQEGRRTPIERPSAERLREATARYQQDWLRRARPGRFVFNQPELPLRKHDLAPPVPPEQRPNIIVLSLETFRAKEMASINEAAPTPSATPFLDSLAAAPNSARYVRYYANGVPTVYAFMAIHTSLLMHPRRSIPAEATSQSIDGFPAALRAHGYRTLHFTGSDPDWDSQRVWLNRWYDEVHYSPEHKERDRLTFRHAAQRLKEIGKQSGPFLAYLVSITNHTPFNSPDPQLDITQGDSARDKLRNTMHYTDEVVRELYRSLEQEPWFARTIWIITGDHGFDLGDRGEQLGHNNLRHETTWVPLILHGIDARLPRGRRDCVSSHLDLAPTVSELAGVYEDNSYMGHSLLDGDCAAQSTLILRGENYAYETEAYSLYKPAGGQPVVYAGQDLEQKSALSAPPAAFLSEAEQQARTHELLVTFTVDFDQHSPRTLPLPKVSAAEAR